MNKIKGSSPARLPARPAAGLPDQGSAGKPPEYVREALRGLTKVQRKYVKDGAIHGDCTMRTVRALKSAGLFYHHIDSPNGRCGPMLLTPLGESVRRILKDADHPASIPSEASTAAPATDEPL